MDRDLRFQLLRAVVRDRLFLKQASRDIRPQDFKLREEALIAEVATAFYERHEEPIGILLKSELEEALKKEKFGAEAKAKLKTLVDLVLEPGGDLVPVKALVDRTKALKTTAFFDEALGEILEANEKDELTPSMLADLVERANRELSTDEIVAHSYKEGLEQRIDRRAKWDDSKYPLFLIDGLDERIKGLGRGQLGMWVAPPNAGKSPALLHMAVAYAVQGLNVLHITLEDPREEVENRLDASLTGIPLDKLRKLPNKLRNRWERISKTLKGNIRVIDGTDGGWSVSLVEKTWHEQKRQGFTADCIIVDYDDELECNIQFKGESARRMQFAEIYRQLRKLAARLNVIVWTAAQTKQGALGRKVIGMGDLAEDFSKARKCFLAIGIGSDKEVDDLHFLHVMRNKVGRKGFIVEIVSRFEAGCFYDREATMKHYKEEGKLSA